MDSLLNTVETAYMGLAAAVAAGGAVVVILMAMSVLMLGIVLAKVVQFRACRLHRDDGVTPALAALRAGRTQAAQEALQGARHPAARVLTAAIAGRHRGRLGEARLREEIERLGAGMLEQLRAYLRTLEVIATLSPLLGLFGTVLGMIAAFQQMEQAGSRVDPSVLSGGIWEALLTTAAGLAVAIPATAAANWLDRVVERVGHAMSDAVTQVFTLSAPAANEDSHDDGHARAQVAVHTAA
jgi:biopolymer transport protein ExbB